MTADKQTNKQTNKQTKTISYLCFPFFLRRVGKRFTECAEQTARPTLLAASCLVSIARQGSSNDSEPTGTQRVHYPTGSTRTKRRKYSTTTRNKRRYRPKSGGAVVQGNTILQLLVSRNERPNATFYPNDLARNQRNGDGNSEKSK